MSVPEKLLVSTSHSLLLFDSGSGTATPLHRGAGLYFGIATDGQRYFVAARGRMVSSDLAAEDERGRILVFDRALRAVGELAPPFAMRDLHEILWHDGRLWATCSFDNMIAVHDERSGQWEEWHPLGRAPAPPHDVNHLNSLAVIDGALHVIAHNFGASELLRFSLEDRSLLSRAPFGVQAHNIRALDDGVLMTCSSADGALVATDGWRMDVGGFPRGIHRGKSETYVGISEITERKDRDLSMGRIEVFDRRWRHLRSHSLHGEGLVLDIAPLA